RGVRAPMRGQSPRQIYRDPYAMPPQGMDQQTNGPPTDRYGAPEDGPSSYGYGPTGPKIAPSKTRRY
ncbi:MAG TPA: hypothetical protein VFI48_11675, partial [Hyphomicrobiaceae bacterium]|nr:hypothetical protein [Hyphomicrobiaceae bacterium]